VPSFVCRPCALAKMLHCSPELGGGSVFKCQAARSFVCRNTVLAQVFCASGAQPVTLYRCRKCRRLLVTSDNVVDVEAVGSRKRTEFSGSGPRSATAAVDESSLFVEPVRWMEAIVTDVRGKLHCPK
jgi:hypothetical protein